MILSDREVKAAMARGAIALTPMPEARAWASMSVDLQLADELIVWDDPGAGGRVPIDPAAPDFEFEAVKAAYSKPLKIAADGYLFRKQSFALGWTTHKLKLPNQSRYAARVEGKSGLARLGIGVHVTAPTIHAGFGDRSGDPTYPGSPIQLEIWNVGPLDILLRTGMPICQLIFECVDGTPEQGYAGRFAVQGPMP